MTLILDERPLVIMPKLAALIGLNEAIVIQQLHYWLQKSNNVHDGYTWVYNSIPGWVEQFPFWSESTVKRTLKSLETQGLVVSGNFNKDTRDKTKWYRIDWDVLGQLGSSGVDDASGQNDPMEQVNLTQCTESTCTDAQGQNDPTITIDYTENTSEITAETNKPPIGHTPPSGDQKKSGKKSNKDDYVFEPPDWLDLESFNQFVQMRKQIKKPMTEYGKHLAALELIKLETQGNYHVDVINQSIMRGWLGLFPLRADYVSPSQAKGASQVAGNHQAFQNFLNGGRNNA